MEGRKKNKKNRTYKHGISRKMPTEGLLESCADINFASTVCSDIGPPVGYVSYELHNGIAACAGWMGREGVWGGGRG